MIDDLFGYTGLTLDEALSSSTMDLYNKKFAKEFQGSIKMDLMKCY